MRQILFSFFVCSLLFLSNSSVLAAAISPENLSGDEMEQQASLTQVASVEDKVVLPENILLKDVVVAEEAGVFRGQFSLQASTGQQNDIAYGIVVQDSEGNIKSVTELARGAVLNKDEVRMIPFEYTIPPYVSGHVVLSLLVETSGGFPLGSWQLAEKQIGEENGMIPICLSNTTKPVFSCTPIEDGDLTITYRKGGVFGETVKTNVIAGKKGVRIDTRPVFVPGNYFVTISDAQQSHQSFLNLHFSGTFAWMKNVVVNKNDAGKSVVTVSIDSSLHNKLLLGAILKNDNGTICGKKEEAFKGQVVSLQFDEECESGTVEVTLQNIIDGMTLDMLSQSFLIDTVKQPISPSLGTLPFSISFIGWNNVVILVIILCSLCGCIYVARKRFPDVFSKKNLDKSE
jgi:hypothetical protein